jgi:tRNA (guanine37-N1)-methyltransferase
MTNLLAVVREWFLNQSRSLNVLSLCRKRRSYDHIIFTTPKGKIFNQKIANDLSLSKNIIVIAGHYKEVDDRVRLKFATDEISIGNFVLTGGELPALIIIDAVVRLITGSS